MATATPVTYVLDSSGKVGAGCLAPGQYPAWQKVMPLNLVKAIANTVSAGSVHYPNDKPSWEGGGYLQESTSAINYSGAFYGNGRWGTLIGGGHGDGWTNPVNIWHMLKDVITLEVLMPSSDISARIWDSSYYKDGKPTPRHSYWCPNFVPLHDKLCTFDSYSAYGSGNFGTHNADMFDMNTRTWSKPWAVGVIGENACVDHLGNGFHAYDYYAWRWDARTNKRTIVANFPTGQPYGGRPIAYDVNRDAFFCLSMGDGEQGGSSLFVCNVFRGPTYSTRQPITFSGNADVVQQFRDHAGTKAGMTYDSVNDKFYWYDGRGLRNTTIDRRGIMFVVTPNETNDWTITRRDVQAGDELMPQTEGTGMYNRVRYIKELAGIVFHPSQQDNLYFMRTS